MTTQEFIQLRALITPQDQLPLHKIWNELKPYMCKVCNKLGFPQEEYIGEAYICLTTCIARWDPNKGNLYSYAGYRLKAYLQETRRKEAVVVLLQRDYKKGERCKTAEYLVDEDGEPDFPELSL